MAELWLGAWWLGCAWLNYAAACHRWTPAGCTLSVGLSASAALIGWHLTRRGADRYDDAHLGNLLRWVEDAPAYALSLHPAQAVKRWHTSHCLRRWGLTPRTSGWQGFCRSWKKDAAWAFVCLVVTMHAWWLAV